MIEEIINSWDPIELLGIAPSDEYSYEIARIYNIVHSRKVTIDTLTDDIYNIFSDSFGEIFTKSKDECSVIAAKIVALTGDIDE